MSDIISYIKIFFRDVNKMVLLLCSLQTAFLIFLNYNNHLELTLTTAAGIPWPAFTGHYIIFFFAFLLPYLYYAIIDKKKYFQNKPFNFLLVVAPVLFSLKMAINTNLPFSADREWNEYWNQVYYWPARVIMMVAILFLIWRAFDKNQPFYGLTTKKIKWKPYWLMLLIMLPLIAAASTQHDFLSVYPKLKSELGDLNYSQLTFWHKLFFELAYGSDFFSIEIFFRGFLILAFLKWVGKDAILPMACFYCTIHFGKPLGECISSYFGGMILGIVVYNTRSIYGGLMVHLGIAWLMELGGYTGNYFFH